MDERKPEQIRIDGSGAAPLPRVARDDEAIMRNVERVEIQLEGLALHRIELRIDQYPAPLGRVPVLGNPVIFKAAGVEVCAEPASCPRGRSLLSQDAHQ